MSEFDPAMTAAVNAVVPAVQAWEARRQQQIGIGRKLLDAATHREPMFLPLSLRVGIAQAVVKALTEAGLLAAPDDRSPTRIFADHLRSDGDPVLAARADELDARPRKDRT